MPPSLAPPSLIPAPTIQIVKIKSSPQTAFLLAKASSRGWGKPLSGQTFRNDVCLQLASSSSGEESLFWFSWMNETCTGQQWWWLVKRDTVESEQGFCLHSPRNPRRDKLPGNSLGLPAPSVLCSPFALCVWENPGCSVLCYCEWVGFFPRLRILEILWIEMRVK